MFDVIGLGVSTLDLLQVVDELPAEEMVQRAYMTALQGGGPIATAMVTLAKLGSNVAMIDRLGDDWRGKLILDSFVRAGVFTAHITVDAGKTSSIASIQVRKADGHRAITFSPGTSSELNANDISKDVIRSAKVLHVNGRHLQAALRAAEYAKEQGVMVSFDGGAHRYRPELDALISLADVLIIAQQFALQSVDAHEINEAVQRLSAYGPKLIVITAGEAGCWVFPAVGHSFYQPAFSIPNVVDTTGAGDAFHGAFLHGLINRQTLHKSAQLASAVAAMNTQRLGGQSGLPSYNEVNQFIRAKLKTP